MKGEIPEGYVLVPIEPPFPKEFVACGTRNVNGVSTEVVLQWSDEGGGWYQWHVGPPSMGKHFKSDKAALEAAKACTGPWFNEPAQSTIRTVEVENKKAALYRAMCIAAKEG